MEKTTRELILNELENLAVEKDNHKKMRNDPDFDEFNKLKISLLETEIALFKRVIIEDNVTALYSITDNIN